MWKKTGAVYDGDWKDNMRHGFGMYSMKQGDVFVKQYAGGWKEDMRDVSCVIGYACMFLSNATVENAVNFQPNHISHEHSFLLLQKTSDMWDYEIIMSVHRYRKLEGSKCF